VSEERISAGSVVFNMCVLDGVSGVKTPTILSSHAASFASLLLHHQHICSCFVNNNEEHDVTR